MKTPNVWYIGLEFDQIQEGDPGMWLVSRERDDDGRSAVILHRFGPKEYPAAVAAAIMVGQRENLAVVETKPYAGTKTTIYTPARGGKPAAVQPGCGGLPPEEPRKIVTDASCSTVYAVLIRHGGFIDRFARRVPSPTYPATSINAWVNNGFSEVEGFRVEEMAKEYARMLTEAFGKEKYRFAVVKRILVPRWFIAEPANDRELTRPVGSVEQL